MRCFIVWIIESNQSEEAGSNDKISHFDNILAKECCTRREKYENKNNSDS